MSPPPAPAAHATEEFQYLSVLVSIILGLGIAQLLTNVGRLAQSRARVRHYWPADVWTVLLFGTAGLFAAYVTLLFARLR